jgi:hypothetical protein
MAHSTTRELIGNSVFEGMRDPEVKVIYVIFGKMGGMPSVKWGRYEDRITQACSERPPEPSPDRDRSERHLRPPTPRMAFAGCVGM